MASLRQIHVPSGLAHNLFALYGLYCSGYLLALVTVPYLSRVLGPSDWGLVAFVQAFGGYLLLTVEFGFSLSATREAARRRHSREGLANLLAGVLGAKVLLVSACLLAATGVKSFIPAFQQHPALFWSGVFWALLQGSNIMWFYQALERMRLAVTIDLTAKSAAVVAVFCLVRGPADDWKVLAAQGGASLLSLAASLGLAYREVPFRIPSMPVVTDALRRSVTTFVPRNASIMYTVGNAFILGLFAPPHVVGYYAGADRISRAIVGLLGPASDAVYPRISHLAKLSRVKTQRLARLAAAGMGAAGLVMGLLMFWFSPQLVHILLGKGYEPATALLRVFSLIPPAVALRNVLGVHWMLPLDLDRPFNLIVLGAGLLNIAVALVLAPLYADLGMAWAAALSQVGAAVATYGVLRWMQLDPLSGCKADPPAACGPERELEYTYDHLAE